MDANVRAAGSDLLRAGLSDDDLEVVVAAIAAVWHRRALGAEEIWPQDGELAKQVFASLAEAGRAEIDGDGRLVGVHGFTLNRTRHAIVHDGVEHNTWCAFDSVGIPGAFGLDAVATTDCPTCGHALSITIGGGVPDTTGPGGGELALWLPSSTETCNLMGQFCASADIYCSRAHLEESIDTATATGTVLTLAEAAEVGKETWADVAHVTDVL